MDKYLNQFRSNARHRFKREMKQAQEAGVRFETSNDLARLGDCLETLYDSTYSKYGEDHFYHPAKFWSALEKFLGPQAEAIVAYRGGEPVGFSLLLNKQDDLWFYRVGRSYKGNESQASTYFNLAF